MSHPSDAVSIALNRTQMQWGDPPEWQVHAERRTQPVGGRNHTAGGQCCGETGFVLVMTR